MIKYVYELIGTFFLVFTVGMTVLDPHSVALFAPLAIGSVLAAMVFAGGHISGGHYNPAVSFSVFLYGKLSWKNLIGYWVVQFLASVIAAYATVYYKGVVPQTPLQLETMRAFLAEFLFTFALCFVVFNVALAKGTKGNSFYGWAIGLIVLVGAYAVGTISGAAFNPAVALGITLMKLSVWSNLWIFFAANFLAGLCAALIFKLTDAKN